MTGAPQPPQWSQGRRAAADPSIDLGACVGGLMNTVARGMEAEVAPHGLTSLQFTLLRVFLQGEEWTATQLAQVLPVHVSRISRMVSRLVDRGLLSRRRPRSDRRIVLLSLTDEGTALTSELDRRVRAFDARLAEGVSEEEMAALASATSKIVANHSAMKRTRAP
jgi:DNA-binding MarR family transcriptional regulator